MYVTQPGIWVNEKMKEKKGKEEEEKEGEEERGSSAGRGLAMARHNTGFSVLVYLLPFQGP